MEDYEVLEDDTEVYYAAWEQEEVENHSHNGCGGCLISALVILLFVGFLVLIYM